jgi:hypothetical protein
MITEIVCYNIDDRKELLQRAKEVRGRSAAADVLAQAE